MEWAERLVRELEPTRRVLIPHLPGYGRTPAASPYRWRAVTAALGLELGRRTGGAPAVLIGLSGGARRALELAADELLPVRGILGLGALASLEEAERAGFRQFAAALRSGADLSALAGPRFLARRVGDAAAVAQVQAWLRAAAPAALADELEALAAEPDLIPRLGRVRCPVVLRTAHRPPRLACPSEVEERARRPVLPGATTLPCC